MAQGGGGGGVVRQGRGRFFDLQGHEEPHGGPYQPELATPSVCGEPPVPKERPEYHLPGPEAVG